MAKFISAGHCNVQGPNYDPGASGVHGRTEANETVKMRNAVVGRLTSKGATDVITDLDNESLKQYLQRIKTGTGSFVMEFHFNAFNGQATGVEVVVQEDADKMDIACAREIADFTAQATGLPLRSGGVIKESQTARKRLGLMREAGIVVLVELCFIDNESDMARYDRAFDTLADFYAIIALKYDKLIQ
jgi:N-acetylmuramoyl-L-alanine amidase